jgi:hypothetical protein
MSRKVVLTVVAISLLAFLAACGSGNNPMQQQGNNATATVYMTGNDAPLASVLSFRITITDLKLSDGTNTYDLISAPETVDFARFVGLNTLLALQSVPPGSYNSLSVTFSSPTVEYLDITQTPAAAVALNGDLVANSTIVQTLGTPLTVGTNGLGGLSMHFDVAKSVATDSTGNIVVGSDGNAQVTPYIRFRSFTSESDDDADVDEFHGGLVSVNTSNGTFIVQNIRGRQFTVDTQTSTVYDGFSDLSALTPPAILGISGKVQADGSILASQVELESTTKAYMSGLILNVMPSSGAATGVNLLVRDELPDLSGSGITVGVPSQVNFASGTTFSIWKFPTLLSSYLFSDTSLIPGQDIGIAATIDSTVTPPAVNTVHVRLHRQGAAGQLAVGSVAAVSGNTGSFTLNVEGMFGYIMGNSLTIETTDYTRWKGGLTGLSDLAGAGTALNIEVSGLLLKDSTTGKAVLLAGVVRELSPDE